MAINSEQYGDDCLRREHSVGKCRRGIWTHQFTSSTRLWFMLCRFLRYVSRSRRSQVGRPFFNSDGLEYSGCNGLAIVSSIDYACCCMNVLAENRPSVMATSVVPQSDSQTVSLLGTNIECKVHNTYWEDQASRWPPHRIPCGHLQIASGQPSMTMFQLAPP